MLDRSGYTKGDTDLWTDGKPCLSDLVIERDHLRIHHRPCSADRSAYLLGKFLKQCKVIILKDSSSADYYNFSSKDASRLVLCFNFLDDLNPGITDLDIILIFYLRLAAFCFLLRSIYARPYRHHLRIISVSGDNSHEYILAE